MLQNVKREIELKLPYLVSSFGGWDRFLYLLNNKYNIVNSPEEERIISSSLLLDLDSFLSHTHSLTILSPWNFSINLHQEDELTSKDGAVLEEPYKVYNSQGELLYSVSGHNGVFGLSILDKTLLLQSKETEIYYLQYLLYSGIVVTKLLLINLTVPESFSINNKVKYPIIIEEDNSKSLVNQILFTYEGFVKANASINVYLLPAAPINNISKEDIINNPYVIKQNYLLFDNKSFIYTSNQTGWLVLTIENNSINEGEQFVKLSSPLGKGIDRFISINEHHYLHYVRVGSDLDPNIVYKNLGVSFTPSSISSSNFNLQVSISA